MFTWDLTKALLNYDKHGVSFEEAVTIFSDVNGLDWSDRAHSIVEVRRKRLARSESGRILLVVYTERKLASGKETTRIISARQASRKERQAYAR